MVQPSSLIRDKHGSLFRRRGILPVILSHLITGVYVLIVYVEVRRFLPQPAAIFSNLPFAAAGFGLNPNIESIYRIPIQNGNPNILLHGANLKKRNECLQVYADATAGTLVQYSQAKSLRSRTLFLLGKPHHRCMAGPPFP